MLVRPRRPGSTAGYLVPKTIRQPLVAKGCTIGVSDALRNGDQQATALFQPAAYSGQEGLLVKRDLGQIYEMLTGHFMGKQR